jgi:light-regulated signal transduction histidine kinase (bacteriophytochrome)
VEISGVPIELDGMPVLFNSSRDISRRKAATEEIHRLNASLESRVSERTRDLLAANQELEAFSYSVAHDLRTPLRAISSFAQVIEEDCASGLDDAGKDALQRVQKAASRMGQLIDDVLRLSRLTRQEMLLETVDLGALACANIEELRAVEPGRSVICEIPAQLLVRGDKRLLDILLGNLIRNAWKFTGKQIGARIELGAGKCGPDTVYFVRDNGAGFDMAHSANLFRPFHRAHSVDDFAGTGIGLATVKRIVERHNGRVWAEGAPDKGATFYFTLSA